MPDVSLDVVPKYWSPFGIMVFSGRVTKSDPLAQRLQMYLLSVLSGSW